MRSGIGYLLLMNMWLTRILHSAHVFFRLLNIFRGPAFERVIPLFPASTVELQHQVISHLLLQYIWREGGQQEESHTN